jgi:hypothetical protein
MRVKIYGEPWEVIFKTRGEGDTGKGFSVPETREIYIYDDVEGAISPVIASLARAIYNPPADDYGLGDYEDV